MALKRDALYPGRFDPPTDEHPQGAFKNRTSDTSNDGSYLEKKWLNDWDGFFSSLLESQDLTPNGAVDEVGNSQYFDALEAMTNNGQEIEIASQEEVNSGVVDNKIVTPLKLLSGFSFLFASTGYIVFPKFMGNFIIQWGSIAANSTTVTYLIPFPVQCVYFDRAWISHPGDAYSQYMGANASPGQTSASIVSTTTAATRYFAIGY